MRTLKPTPSGSGKSATEAEWEFASRGGLNGAEFVWGDAFTLDGKQMANTWQGEFPWQNLKEDGFEGTAPVGSFPANGYGLYEMAGNVWEWTTGGIRSTEKFRNRAAPTSIREAENKTRVTIQHARHQNPAQSNERRVAPLRAELLPALPAGGAHGPAHRYLDVPSRISLHRSSE